MKSKLLPILATMVFTAVASYSQIPEVMVGDTAVIATLIQYPSNSNEQYCASPPYGFSLMHHSNANFSYFFIQGQSEPLSYGTYPDIARVLCFAMSSIIF